MARIAREAIPDTEELSISLRAGLNHYAQYVVPLRACRNGGFTLPEQAIEVKLLDCSQVANLSQWEHDASLRHEARRDPQRWRYAITSGTPVAIQVRNTLAVDLYVFLMICNLEGQIEFLDGDVLVKARSGKLFWHQNIISKPFVLVSPDGYVWGIDRLVAIATDQKGMDLRVLDQRLTMQEAMREALGTRSVEMTARNPPALRWTAVQTLIQICGPDATSPS